MPIDTDDGRCAAVLYVMDSNDYNADDGTYAGVDAGQVAWYERRSEELERRCGAKVGALIFMHIPLPEYAEAFDGDPARVGFRLESECPGRDNHGMFEAMVRRGDVRGVFAGHDHSNDYAAMLRGHRPLAYGRYSGGYAEYQELVSGARVIELHRDRPGFVTWVRLANGREGAPRGDTPAPEQTHDTQSAGTDPPVRRPEKMTTVMKRSNTPSKLSPQRGARIALLLSGCCAVCTLTVTGLLPRPLSTRFFLCGLLALSARCIRVVLPRMTPRQREWLYVWVYVPLFCFFLPGSALWRDTEAGLGERIRTPAYVAVAFLFIAAHIFYFLYKTNRK